MPIICCGETLEQYEAGQAEEVVEKQVTAALAGFSEDQVASKLPMNQFKDWGLANPGNQRRRTKMCSEFVQS